MQTFREQLVEKMNILSSQLKDIRDELEKFDFESKFNDAKQFLGKCYIETDLDVDEIRCFYIFGISEINATLNCLEIFYFKNTPTYFEIRYNYTFHPVNDRDYADYQEITKEEFDAHFEIVKEYITNIKNTKLC
jgi:hypothetical protein